MVGRPLKLLGVVPVASKHFVATVNADARPGQRIGHDLQTGVPAGTFHLAEGDVHRTVGLADAAGVAFARGLSVDADLELLPLGDHETVGTDVKLNFNDAQEQPPPPKGLGEHGSSSCRFSEVICVSPDLRENVTSAVDPSEPRNWM